MDAQITEEELEIVFEPLKKLIIEGRETGAEAVECRENVVNYLMERVKANMCTMMPGTKDLAQRLQAVGRNGMAQLLYDVMLKVHLEENGEEHPDTWSAIKDAADCLQRQDKKDEARDLYRMLLDVRMRTLDEDHPHILLKMEEFGRFLNTMGWQDESIKLWQGIVNTREKVYGEQHKDTLRCMKYLATIFYDMKRYREAIEIQERIFHLLIETKGPDAEETRIAFHDLERTLYKDGRNEQAEQMFRRWREAKAEFSGK